MSRKESQPKPEGVKKPSPPPAPPRRPGVKRITEGSDPISRPRGADPQKRIDQLESEVEALNGWIADMQSGMYINCVYCGHRYPPGTPDVRDKALYAHIKKCPKHPLSKALALLKEADSVLETAELLYARLGQKSEAEKIRAMIRKIRGMK